MHRTFKNASQNTKLRMALASVAAVSGAIAVSNRQQKMLSPLLVGAAILAAQASSVVGNAAVGRVVSSTRQEVRRSKGETAKLADQLSLSGLTPSTTTSPVPSKPSTEHVVKPLEVSTSISSADPKNRRPGREPKYTASSALMESRRRVPISGDAAVSWIDNRATKGTYYPQETNPPFRAGDLPFASDIRVAMIADDFSYHSYSPEFDVRRLTPQNWREVFEKHKPQFFFCESAWQGGDPKHRPWQGKIYASVRWPAENRTVLLEILEHCHKVGVPTVFWNKEDPTHFGDRINDFIRTAALFDYVFTTAAECVESYQRDVGISHVDVLPFAVQPKLFNPQGILAAKNSVNFAGTWYARYKDRCQSAASIMDQVLDANLDLEIYDRMYSSPDDSYRYPEKYRQFTKPAIPYTHLPRAYKESKFGITLNTVKDSKTMFARRVFELAASGSVVLSNYAVGVDEYFGDSVLYPDRDFGVLQELNDEQYRDLQQRSMDVALNNTYAHRAEQILNILNVDYRSSFEQPAGLVSVSSLSEYEHVLGKFRNNEGLSKLLVTVASTSEQSLEMKLLMRRDAHVTVVNEDALKLHEFRVRNYLSNHGVITANDKLEWPEAEQIARLVSHRSHYPGAIAKATMPSDRYTEKDLNPTSWAYIPASLIGDYLGGIGTLTAFQV